VRQGRADVDLSVRLGPIELANPIVAASGTFGHGDEVARLCDPSGLGAVTVKSLSAFEWAGNAAPRVHEATAGMLNAVGLQNPGVAYWVKEELPALEALGATVIASIWGRTVDEFAEAARGLAPVADRIVACELNLSCPNLDAASHMFAHSTAATAATVDVVREALAPLPILAKLSPNTWELPVIAHAALDAGATGLTLVNTVLGLALDPVRRRYRLSNRSGGLSGPAIKPVALRAVHEVWAGRPGTPIIGTGGVASGDDAVEMLLAGATAVGVGTATFRDPKAPLKIRHALERWCVRQGVSRVTDLIGAIHDADRS
jgi:dihydroorotate dehydrogenase (NAD+) catalytic subunit